jgi:glycosyltransferase involved in cell wall biosynthesis
MKVLFFANKMPDLCGAFLHDIDLGTELLRRGHQVVFLTIKIPSTGMSGGTYRGFRYLHYSAASSFLETSEVWICPHAPILPEVRRLNARSYNRPIIATCHYDGNYTMITGNSGRGWSEMLCFINRIMEVNYRRNISPWPAQIVRTETIRPIMHRDQIVISEPFQGDYITLINANENKGVHQFLELARRMPDRKFLGVRPYYGNMTTPLPLGGNIEWVPFSDDIRTILRRTRILLVPSYYESFGRVAVEAMINGIPVLYSKAARTSPYPGGSMEGMQSWIGDAAMQCDRDRIDEWKAAIETLDDEDTYAAWSEKSKSHIESMELFTEASRIAGLVESFSREHPVAIRAAQPAGQETQRRELMPAMPKEPLGPVGFGFVNGRLRIQR